ncbi:MAG: 1,4-dihydroxy-2-naphthoate polyprenyltransferase [Sphaerobacteraceae bacterium]|nr:MAG: 1,4-dihydroxy-2-naphthoate polyprenyltransferase [Sphaerobacteraceae bacterium]
MSSETIAPAQSAGIGSWVLAARIPTLPAAAVPVIVGTAVGASIESFQFLPFLGAFVAALLIQIATNFANDYADAAKGADTPDRLGPTRATSAGLISASAMKRATFITFGLAMLIGVYLITVGGWPILFIGIFSILFGLAYTGGPYPLAYNGLGDIAVFIFFGLIAVVGSSYLQTGSLDGLAVAAAVPIGLLITGILVINNLRDIHTDARANKRTLAVKIGEEATRYQYISFLIIAWLVPLGMWLSGATSPWVLLSWISIPLGIVLIRMVGSGLSGRPLNAVLKRTGLLLLLYGIPLATGIII